MHSISFSTASSLLSLLPTMSQKRRSVGVQKPEEMRECDFMTITFAESVENHAGMQSIGCKLPTGLSRTFLQDICKNSDYVLHHLRCEDDAGLVVVVPNGVERLLGAMGDRQKKPAAQALYEEILGQSFDNQFYNVKRRRVMYKHGRLNNCFADIEQAPQLSVGKGTVVNFSSVPLLSKLRQRLPSLVADSDAKKLLSNLYAETNLYVNVRKKSTGIGFHGDTERSLVVGVRLGPAQQPLRFQWFRRSEKQGAEYIVNLEEGDIYIMCEKAVGGDWLRKKKLTLRHGVGLKAQ